MPRTGAERSLRAWLLISGAAGLLGASLVAAVVAYDSWQTQRQRLDTVLAATSKAITESVEGELDEAVTVAHTLTISPELAAGDVDTFEKLARKVIAPYGFSIAIAPLGSPLRLVQTAQPIANVSASLSSAEPPSSPKDEPVTIAPLARSESGHWMITVRVPVHAGEREYRIDMGIPASEFQKILDAQHLPAAWTPVILDANWIVVARDPGRERFIGEPAAAREFQHLPDAVHEVRLLEGDTARSAHSHSVHYGWTTAVAVPDSVSRREFIGPVLAVGASGFGVAAVAIGGILLCAFYLARGIGALADAAAALGDEGAIVLPRLPVRELAQVGEKLQEAAAKITDNRRQLEVRISEVTSDLRHEEEERRKTEAALAHAQRLEALGQLTSGIAHDFNNLLSVILGSAEAIEKRAPNDHLLRLARQAKQGAERGARLVQALLAFARKQPLRPEIADPNALIREFEPILRGAAGDTVQVEFRLGPAVHQCRVDAAQFQSCLLNLVSNACAAMPGGGRITIETKNVDDLPGERTREDAAGFVQISVSDTGPGMAPSVLAKAFEPFFTTKEVGKGSGLGLSQVYGFARQSGGDARLRSEQGVGTTVEIYLPRSLERETPAADTETSEMAEPAPDAKRATVMVVDDNAAVRAVLVEMVQELGYAVVEESDGRGALRRIREGEPVDLILTDYLMPNGMSGRDLVREVRAINPGVNILMMSGAAPESSEGDVPILQKPVPMATLRTAIHRALSGARHERSEG